MVVDGKTLDRKCFVLLHSRGRIDFVICAVLYILEKVWLTPNHLPVQFRVQIYLLGRNRELYIPAQHPQCTDLPFCFFITYYIYIYSLDSITPTRIIIRKIPMA